MTDNIEEARLTAKDLRTIHPNMLSRQALKDTADLLDALANELAMLRRLADESAGKVPVSEDFARDLSTALSKAGHHSLARALDAIPPQPRMLFTVTIDVEQAKARIQRTKEQDA